MATPPLPADGERGAQASRGLAAPPRPAGRVAAPRIPLTRRLGFRLAALLAVALMPLGVISLLQGGAWFEAAREQRAAALGGETLRAVAPTVGLIREAQGAAAVMAQMIVPLIDDDGCSAAMTELNRVAPQYSVAAFVPRSGAMTCSSGGRSFDYSDTPLFQEMLAGDFAAKVHVQAPGPVSGEPILLVVHPVRRPGEAAPAGYVGLALPHAALRRAAEGGPGTLEAPDFVTFNGDGTVLSTSSGFGGEADLLPAGLDLATQVGVRASVFSGRTAAGEERLYSVVPIVPDALYALGSVATRDAAGLGGSMAAFTPFASALLMWAGSLVAAWIAAEQLVTRYIRRLGRAIRAFASGSRVVGDLDMDGAPAELREVGQAFLRMTDTILHDEAELEDTVHQREVLLREVHHRVKNNLQLIASIMNMQARRARSPETKALMRGLQERVMSLATVHKELYQTTGLADVRADELLGDLVRQIVGMASGPGRTFHIEQDFAPIPLTPDQAVPLSLLLTEGLTNAIKYAVPDKGEASPRIRLRFFALEGRRAELVIVNAASSAPPEPGPGEGTGLGSQLVAAFASQLGGEVQGETRDGRFTLRVAFALTSLEGAEQRHGG